MMSEPTSPAAEETEREVKRKNMVWTKIYFGREVMERIIETLDPKHTLQKRFQYRYILRAAMAGVVITLMYVFAYQVNADLGAE